MFTPEGLQISYNFQVSQHSFIGQGFKKQEVLEKLIQILVLNNTSFQRVFL